jgi:Excalibur calcium-binding domain
MTAVRLLLAALALPVVLGGQVTVASAAAVNCSAFPSQAAAQAAYRADPAGLANLDADRDGIACEDNPAPFDRTPVILSPVTTQTPTTSPKPVSSSTPATVTPTSTPTAAGSAAARVNCSAFASQAAAQVAYRANPAGLANLDADHDGIACEDNRAPFDRNPVRLSGSASPALPAPPVTGDGSSQPALIVEWTVASLAAALLLALTVVTAVTLRRAPVEVWPWRRR